MDSLTASQPVEVRPGFLPTGHGHLHLVEYRAAAVTPAGTVLVVPPFAEEMNHARRMVHLLGRRIASQGFRLVFPDLHGTGDSSGTFDAASVSAWQEDIAAVRDWCDGIDRVIAIVAIRFGALLAASHHRLRPVDRLVLWDPVLRGEDQVRDFLRLRVVADQFRGQSTGGASGIRGLEERLGAGETLQVAGYPLRPLLASGMRELDLGALLAGTAGPVHWLQMGPAEEGSLPAAAATLVASLRAAGVDVTATRVPGPRFWATTESGPAPVLIDATEQLLGR